MAHPLYLYRKAHGLTLKDVADKLGVALSAVHAWEHGHRYPERQYLLHIRALTGASVEELLGLARTETPDSLKD